MKVFKRKLTKDYSVARIRKTSSNRVVDISESLLTYVQSLPKYSCKASEAYIKKSNSLTKRST